VAPLASIITSNVEGDQSDGWVRADKAKRGVVIRALHSTSTALEWPTARVTVLVLAQYYGSLLTL